MTSFCAFQSSTLATQTSSNHMRGLNQVSRLGRTAVAGSATAPSFSDDVSVEDILSWTKQIKERFLTSVEKIEKNSNNDEATWDDTVGAFSLALGESAEASAIVTLPSMTHADASVRKASTQSKDELKLLFDEVFARPNLYQALCRASPPTSSSSSSSEDAYFDTLLKQQFRRNGSHLENESSRNLLLQKRQELEQICSKFTTSINEHSDDTLEFTEEELHGVDFSNFPIADDESNKRIITLKAPFIKPIMQFATNSQTRKRLSIAMAKKCQEDNTSHFLNALRLRQECADILGYPSHAHYMLQSKMASNPERAESFLLDLIDKIKPQCRKNIFILETLKQEAEETETNKDDSGSLQVWDTTYYQRVYKAKTLGVDEAKLKTYFPLKHVQHEILSMYEELLNLKFSKVEDAEVWHPDVECYSVSPAGTNDILGYFYFDIFPRKGKYSHQCVYPLRPSYHNQDSQQFVKPACVNIGNLNPMKDGEPSLLLFSEVVTFFHEFGHVMHCVLSQSKHSLQAWAWSAVPWPGGVEQDFLEVPSMMLENFVWQPDILRRLSHHIEDGSSLSEDDISALSKSRFMMEGYNRSRYLAMALYDLKVHSPTNKDGLYEYNGESYDAISLYHAMMTDISGISQIPESFPVASWFHPMMGYDAGYYSYIWSETYAADLFSEFEKLKGTSIIDPTLGKKYKECILKPCAMIDGNSMLRSFLGREPSNQAFLNRMMSS